MKRKSRQKWSAEPKIRIETDGVLTFITVDGKRIKGVRELKFVATAGNVPIIQLELNALDAEIISCVDLPIKCFRSGGMEAEYEKSGI